jgi:hypothetical protein|tara:strand:+ start:6727 stop:9165 length:2439 start_codon:yes stop_codon:yes gene_type:complete
MEQDNFQIYGNGVQYQPVRQPDLIPAIDRELARQRRGDEQYLAQVRRNNEQRVANAKLRDQDIAALTQFSKTLVDSLVENQKQQNEDDLAEGIEEGYRQHLEGGLNTSSYDQGIASAKEQDAIASDVEASVQDNNPDNYEASANIGRATTWKEVGRRRGFALAAATGYPTFVDQELANQQFNSSAEYSAALVEVRKKFYKEAGLTGLDPKFLASSVYPQLQRADATSMRKWQKQFAQDDSFERQSEAKATLSATKDVSSFLSATRSTVGKDGMPLGFSGAWSLFESSVTDAVAAGDFSESDIVAMENQLIPGDAKGRTYGELYSARFGKIRRQAAAQRRTDWNNSETDRRQEFEQAEQELVNAFLDSSDTDGFSDDQIDDAIDTLRDRYGMESRELSALKQSTVDAKTREKQEEEIENLMANNLLTTARLKNFDPQLQLKYRSTAQTTDKLLADNGGMKVQLDAIKDAVEFKAGVTRDSRRHPTVGLMIARQQQKFQRLVTQYAVAGNPDPVNAALNEVLTSFEQVPVSANAYSSSFNFGAKNANEQMDYRIRFIDTHLKSYGNQVLNMPNTLFSSDQLQGMVKGFGSEGWNTDPQIDYIANKLGVDPLTVLNAQLKANGMDALPPSPALEAVNKLTPTQQNLINKFKTPERSTRGLMGLQAYTPEVVPKGYGKLVADAAKKHGIDPSILAGLIETESNWNPNAISRSGAKGLTQFMDPTAAEFGVNVFDPASAIDGGAKYLRYLIDYFKGDVRLAIFAYNGGMGNIQRYGGPIPGSTENQEYYGKVMRNAGKYGYGKQALRDPSLIRPSIL